ncbi:Nucleoporin NUP188 [Colletotrichum chlorophyti]|uniref:Nucleoporin NUP188 n=1 Tax=Colletotrichum chlorophyti TaxID=708187 RepID=A0A1Q8RAV4_9PEZI|nr:Nucleoporin NUP188 [Colletotrichum chlorophyti]
MAQVADRLYFPPLEECLNGDNIIISWKLIAAALAENDDARRKSDAVVQFLQDDYVRSLIKDPATTFAPPNDATKSSFETRTAAIHVTPTPNDKFDIKVIKEDAQWLSKNAKVNLIAALRATVIEFQSRPASHLTGPLSSQDAINLQEAAGIANVQSSTLAPISSAALDAETIWTDFEKEESRRKRIFQTYLAERRHFLMTAALVQENVLYPQPSTPTTTSDQSSMSNQLVAVSERPKYLDNLLTTYLQLVTDAIGRLAEGLEGNVEDKGLLVDELELDWMHTALTEVIHALSVIFQSVDGNGDSFAPSSIVGEWFSLMENYGFLNGISAPNEEIASLIMPLRSLICAISIRLLNPSRSIECLAEEQPEYRGDEDPYITAPSVLEQVHNAILSAANADCESQSPVIFAWTVIVHRMFYSHHGRVEKRDTLQNQRSQETFEAGALIRPSTGRRLSAGSIVSIEGKSFDHFLTSAGLDKDLQVVEQLAVAVTSHGRAYEVLSEMALDVGASGEGAYSPLLSSRIRLTYVDFLKATYPLVGYQSDSVTSLLSVLSGGQHYWDLFKPRLDPSNDVLAELLQDATALEYYFHQALSRYPFELLPFLTMCRTLANCIVADDRMDTVVNLLRKTPTLTFILPDDYQQYELAQEEDNTNTFYLLEAIPLFTPASAWNRRTRPDDAFRIPAETLGRFVTDTGRVVLMEYEHSALALLGKRLEVQLAPETYHSELEVFQPEETAETIALFATLLRAEVLKSEKQGLSGEASLKSGLDLLEEIGKHIGGNKDLVAVVCETMDVNMQDDKVTEGQGIAILNSCVLFLHAILPLCPTRVWSYLARCELLNSEAQAGKLAKITGNLDLVGDRFTLLLSAVRLFSSLVDSIRSSAVQRRSGNKLIGRQKVSNNVWLGVADKVLGKVSLAIAQAAVDVFETSSTWRFGSELHRTLLIRHVVPVMDHIISHTYGMGGRENSETLTSCLEPAASYIIDAFLSPSTGSLRFQPLLATLVNGLQIPDSTFYQDRLASAQEQLISTLQFTTTLLRVSNYLDRPSATFEDHLFKTSSILARLCAICEQFRRPALLLLEALVLGAAKAHDDPPSLLGYLGPLLSRSFIQVLARLDKPFLVATDVQTTWRFFSTIVQNRQQWLSNCLLTGKTPRDALKDGKKDSTSTPTSVLAIAFTKLKKIKELDLVEALRILDFVASSQNHWPWTIFTMQKDSSFLDSLRLYVKDLSSFTVTSKTDAVKSAIDAKMAAYIAEIFAMQLYHLRQMGGADTFAQSLVTDLDYYLRDGVEVSSYNTSLHSNFAKNFTSKYPGVSLEAFKRTALRPGELGRSYFYDLESATEMLSFDPGWHGRRNNGFRNEMAIANTNLSLVDAQISLFHAWEFLLLELSSSLPDNENIAKQMLQVAQQCLEANRSNQGPENIFMRIVEERADLALLLVQRLVGRPISSHDVNQLLGSLFTIVNAVEEPFNPESISYYRTMLKTIYVTLRAYSAADKKSLGASKNGGEGYSVTLTQTVLNLLDRVVAKGFRTLVTLVHDSEAAVAPEDLALLTAILQACINMPTIDQCQTQILNIMSSHDAMHAATSLFSWADKLAYNGDPIYGELSLLFLLELSTLPAVAEQMACDGLLSHLTSAGVTNFMRRGNISPFSEAVGPQRCYSIWVKGMLPLLLNLLTALGGTVAPEIAYVLNQFPLLLKSSVDRFEAPGASRTASREAPHYVTLLSVSEVHSLALLTRVVAALRSANNRDIPEVQWDAASLLENIDFWLSSRKLLRDRLLPLGQREVEWKSTKTGASDDASVLEGKVLSQLEAVRDVLCVDLEES